MSVHPAFLSFVREFRSNLTIEKNPHPTSKWDKWFICQPVKRIEPIDGVPSLFAITEYPFPVLSIPQVQEIDHRVLHALHDAMWSNQKDAGDIVTEKRRKIMEAHSSDVEDWARGPGYWHFKKWIDQFNLANVASKDPTRELKDLQDKLGRDINR